MKKRILKSVSLIISVVMLLLAVSVPCSADDSQAKTSDLIAYYSFDDINGTTVPDRSGNGHNGTIKGTASVTLGKLGTAINFDKAGDCVAVPHSEDFPQETHQG